MKIYRKTYGVRNLVEWQANIPVGKGRLIVHFTGGSITAYGVTPAVFKTEDPIHQAIIENSGYFKSGRIFLMKSDFIKEVADPVPAAAPAPAASPAPEGKESDGDEGTGNGGAVEAGTDEEGFKIVKASCFEDVRQYLIKNYGFTPSAVRTKALAKAKATANKVKFLIDGKELA